MIGTLHDWEVVDEGLRGLDDLQRRGVCRRIHRKTAHCAGNSRKKKRELYSNGSRVQYMEKEYTQKQHSPFSNLAVSIRVSGVCQERVQQIIIRVLRAQIRSAVRGAWTGVG